MTFSEVKQLLDAGFTKDEIMAFEDPAKVPAADPAKDPEKDPAADPAKAPATDPAKVPEKDPAKDPALSALNENINKLIRTIQASNLQSAHLEKPAAEDITSQVDKIMQGIIRPELKEVK